MEILTDLDRASGLPYKKAMQKKAAKKRSKGSVTKNASVSKAGKKKDATDAKVSRKGINRIVVTDGKIKAR